MSDHTHDCPRCNGYWPCDIEDLIAIRDKARAVLETASATYNDKRTSVDRKKLSDLGLMVKESYKAIPSEFNSSEEAVAK